ncbi:MAG: hypothetical protein EI684_20375 [Candidatus Viridilinea halotolerans]|uniref:Uncharacterized protein n=1 Tax=Candidatus Viridilinea halotolerans TaxID=2491704 RepID=A0A426TS48_9CHLR|nr:MAG: hypothetical protein EI684_20375 [Candidatus Viridilinea halotolerans]
MEFNFRDAKQFWGLEDFMNIHPTQVTNAAKFQCFWNLQEGFREGEALPEPLPPSRIPHQQPRLRRKWHGRVPVFA